MRDILGIKKSVIDAGISMLENGLAVRTWGNISAKVSESNFVITPSGKAYEGMSASDLPVLSITTGDVISSGTFEPSSEYPIHLAIYQERKEANVVMHTHQVYATAIAYIFESNGELALGEPALSRKFDVEIEGMGIRDIGLIERLLPGSRELHDRVRIEIQDTSANCYLMKGHGILIFGENFNDVIAQAVCLEKISKEIYEEIAGVKVADRGNISNDTAMEKRLSKTGKNLAELASCDTEVMRFMEDKHESFIYDYAQVAGNDEIGDHDTFIFDKEIGVVFCKGENEVEARSNRAILEKNARAARIARYAGKKPIDLEICKALHEDYIRNYSRKIDK